MEGSEYVAERQEFDEITFDTVHAAEISNGPLKNVQGALDRVEPTGDAAPAIWVVLSRVFGGGR